MMSRVYEPRYRGASTVIVGLPKVVGLLYRRLLYVSNRMSPRLAAARARRGRVAEPPPSLYAMLGRQCCTAGSARRTPVMQRRAVPARARRRFVRSCSPPAHAALAVAPVSEPAGSGCSAGRAALQALALRHGLERVTPAQVFPGQEAHIAQHFVFGTLEQHGVR
jgi:hypothetical protein